MARIGLNTHVFGQSMFNWLPLPVETGQSIEVPIPPVKGLQEVLVFVSATFGSNVEGEHYYAIYTAALEGGPIPYHYLFLVGGTGKGGCNSDNLWLRIPDEGLPRVVHVQKMSGGPLPAGPDFRSGVAVLNLR